MVVGPGERVIAERLRRYLKAELKRAGVSYAELARRLKDQGLEETEASITAKLNRGTFAATFLVATMKAIEREQFNLGEL
jgi:urease accessory protein UreF